MLNVWFLFIISSLNLTSSVILGWALAIEENILSLSLCLLFSHPCLFAELRFLFIRCLRPAFVLETVMLKCQKWKFLVGLVIVQKCRFFFFGVKKLLRKSLGVCLSCSNQTLEMHILKLYPLLLRFPTRILSLSFLKVCRRIFFCLDNPSSTRYLKS